MAEWWQVILFEFNNAYVVSLASVYKYKTVLYNPSPFRHLQFYIWHTSYEMLGVLSASLAVKLYITHPQSIQTLKVWFPQAYNIADNTPNKLNYFGVWHFCDAISPCVNARLLYTCTVLFHSHCCGEWRHLSGFQCSFHSLCYVHFRAEISPAYVPIFMKWPVQCDMRKHNIAKCSIR